jgi:Tol biopolymer transport system component
MATEQPSDGITWRLTPGMVLGRYRIDALLGVGGMGEVYRAHDTQLRRDVALKILPQAFTRHPDRLARFEREARLLAALNHPNIAAIYGVEESGDLRALILELVEGDTLAERIGPGVPLSIEAALAIARQITEALDAAHEKGVVHRDLKPGNIKVTPGGVVKLLDFGIAMHVHDRAGADASTLTQHHTREGAVVGTPAYMSPEQARGETVDKRTDIWSFGCVLYEMLTGRVAFEGATSADIVAAVLGREPAWAALPPAAPPAVRRVLTRALEKDSKRRLRDIGDARAELETALHERDGDRAVSLVEPSRHDARPRGRLAWIGGAALAAVGVGAGLWLMQRPGPMVAPLETRLEVVTAPTIDPSSIALSPDGGTVAFVAESDGRPMLWLRALSSVAARPLKGTEGASSPFWSPDGRSVGFFADLKVKRIDPGSAEVQTLADAVQALGATWGADGTIVFPANQVSPLLRVSDGGGPVSPLTSLEPGHLGHLFPQHLPDGAHVLYQAVGAPDVQGMYVSRLDGTGSRRLLAGGTRAVFAPSGHLLFVRNGVLFAQALDTTRWMLRGDSVRVADNVAVDLLKAGAPQAVSASSRGSILYRVASAGGRQLTWFDRLGKVLARVDAPDRTRGAAGLSAGMVSLSPDGRRVALTRVPDGNADVWLLDLERGGVATRVTFDRDEDDSGLWTRDGRAVVFATTRNGSLDIYRRPAGGTTDQPLVATPQNTVPADWSPDGRLLLYIVADPESHLDIWALPMDGDKQPFPLVRSPYEDLNPQVSPDGRWLAYQSDESGRHEVYIRPFQRAGAAVPVSIAGGTQPRWRRDGRELFYLGLDRRMMAAKIALAAGGQSVEVGTSVPLFQTLVGGAGIAQRQYEVSPDGQRFLIDVPVEGPTAPLILIQNWKPPAP